jgi:hypothetical protein
MYRNGIRGNLLNETRVRPWLNYCPIQPTAQFLDSNIVVAVSFGFLILWLPQQYQILNNASVNCSSIALNKLGDVILAEQMI